MKLRPYPVYKGSGVPWLGAVPEHWEVLPNRAIFTEVIDRGHPEEQMLSVTITNGVIRQQALLADSSKKDSSNENKSAYKLVQPGDIAYNKMRAWQGAIGVSNYQGIVSPAYIVQRPRAGGDSRFLHYLFRTPAFAKEAERWSYGITSDMWSLRPEHFKMIYACLPPLVEQAAIVHFLDQVDRRIRRYIRAKQQLIKALEEQKQVIIDQVITNGFLKRLPLNVLGLPQQVRSNTGWESCTVRHLIQTRRLEIQDGNHGELHPKASDYVDDGIPFLMANNVRSEALQLKGCAMLTEEHARSLRIGFARPGDVLMTHKATIGQIGIVPDRIVWPFLMLTPQVTYYRTLSPELGRKYLFWYFQSSQFQEQLRVLSLNQSTRRYIGLLEQRNLVICFPSRRLQEEAVCDCENRTETANTAIDNARREIALIREHRTRLIADVVTGKLDVRGLELPAVDEVEAQEDWDEDADVEAEEIVEEAADAGE